MQNYHDMPEISFSQLKLFRESSLNFEQRRKEKIQQTPEMLLGTALHSFIFEPQASVERFAVSPKVDRRTKVGKEAYQRFADRHGGKDCLSLEQFGNLVNMVNALMSHEDAKALLGIENHEAVKEFPIFWDHRSGARVRNKPDCVLSPFAVDLKTTSGGVDEDSWDRTVRQRWYYGQSAIYSQGIEKVYGFRPTWVWVVIQSEPPYEIAIWQANERRLQEATEEVDGLLFEYQKRLETNDWSSRFKGIQVLKGA